MLTFFTAPKPFRDRFDRIQRNALHSWGLLQPRCEIVVFGRAPGAREAAETCGARYVADVECNEHGTPLVSSLFARARETATRPLLAYVNADILFMSDFARAIDAVSTRLDRFLAIGRRYNLDLQESFAFDADWETRLRAMVAEGDQPFIGIDYFVFPRDLWGEIPPFAVGRAWWDNWPIYEARHRRAPVVDLTMMVTAVHQQHDYSHLTGGWSEAYEGPEAARNRALLGGLHNAFGTAEATHVLTPQGLRWRCRSCYPVCCCHPDDLGEMPCDAR
jgi:hypothetical protein